MYFLFYKYRYKYKYFLVSLLPTWQVGKLGLTWILHYLPHDVTLENNILCNYEIAPLDPSLLIVAQSLIYASRYIFGRLI